MAYHSGYYIGGCDRQRQPTKIQLIAYLWVLVYLSSTLIVPTSQKTDNLKCSKLVKLPGSKRVPLTFDGLFKEIDAKDNPKFPEAEDKTTTTTGGGGDTTSTNNTNSTSPTTTTARPKASPTFILDYAMCSLPGDHGAVSETINHAVRFLTSQIDQICNVNGSAYAQITGGNPACLPSEEIACREKLITKGAPKDDCAIEVKAYFNKIDDAKGETNLLTIKTKLCLDILLRGGLEAFRRFILPRRTRNIQPIIDGGLFRLLQYLSDPDFDFNICRTSDPRKEIFPTFFKLKPCQDYKGCGYLNAKEIDYVPTEVVAAIETTCHVIVQTNELRTDPALRNDAILADLRENCGRRDFIQSFHCLAVNTTLRNMLHTYIVHFFGAQSGSNKHIQEYLNGPTGVYRKIKLEAASLIRKLSTRFHFRIPQKGESCAGSVDFSHVWSTTMDYFHAEPDGRLPFAFLERIPLDEFEVVSYMKKMCDIGKDLVCGDKCRCVCPPNDKWRRCNGSSRTRNFWTYWTSLNFIYIITLFLYIL